MRLGERMYAKYRIAENYCGSEDKTSVFAVGCYKTAISHYRATRGEKKQKNLGVLTHVCIALGSKHQELSH